MVERDIRNHAHQRFDHVRRIQPPAHPDFKYGYIEPFPGEMGKGNCRHHLEKTWMPRQLFPLDQILGNAVDLAMQLGKIIIGMSSPFTRMRSLILIR